MNRIFLAAGCALLFLAKLALGGNDFGAYYTKLETGQAWEAFSRTDEFADVIVRLAEPAGKLVFWRGASYLPFWKTAKGQWSFEEIVRRSGDGNHDMPDRDNVYAHAEIIENSPSRIVIHWRYLSRFTGGNPHGDVDPQNFVDEVFVITPDGHITRSIKQATRTIDQWNDPHNQVVQELQLTDSGITQISRTEPGQPAVLAPIDGNPERGPPVISPSARFKFDEAVGDVTHEQMSGAAVKIPGDKTLWKRGISGTALEFDGYRTVVALPEATSPAVNGKSLTLEAWFALAAYPWNWAPIAQQGDDDGYFLGIDSHGYPGFMLQIDGKWEQLTVPSKPPYRDANHLSLFRWFHIVGSYDKNEGVMCLYIDGKKVASKRVGHGGVQTAHADVRIGKASVLRKPTEGVNHNLPSEYGLDGLIDEVKIFDVALSETQVGKSYAIFDPGDAIVAAPDLQKRAFPDLETHSGNEHQFQAAYTRLSYYDAWDNLWRFGPYADVVVSFDQTSNHYVFWHGASYVPIMANESHQWYTNEFSETGFTAKAPGDCEPMSDKGCWDSHVRIIEATPARVVIHWRYRLANPDHHWANYNAATGWGDIADWYYFIYPDGVASKRLRCYTSEPKAWHEWDEQIVVMSEGQNPADVIAQKPVMTLVDQAGHATDYDWITSPPKPAYRGKIIQKICLTGAFSPFTIQAFTGGDIYKPELWASVTPWWNHWPTAQINSSGRDASFADRASHSSISHLFWPYSHREGGQSPFDEKVLLEGLTDQSAASLIDLARSWLAAPAVSNVSGALSGGYVQSQRAYLFTLSQDKLSFDIDASEVSPIKNLCFVIKNWRDRTSSATLKIDGVVQPQGPDFRQGIIIDTDGTYSAVIWVGVSSKSPRHFEVMKH